MVAPSINDNEVYAFSERMRQDDDEFSTGHYMIQETEDHTNRDHWELGLKSEIKSSVPIKSILSFKRKGQLERLSLQHKAIDSVHMEVVYKLRE